MVDVPVTAQKWGFVSQLVRKPLAYPLALAVSEYVCVSVVIGMIIMLPSGLVAVASNRPV